MSNEYGISPVNVAAVVFCQFHWVRQGELHQVMSSLRREIEKVLLKYYTIKMFRE